MTLKEELKLVINAHLPKAVWGEVERVKYYLTFPFATKSIDKKMAMKIKSLKGVSKFYARRRKDKMVFVFIFSKRFFD
ncbi:hypothetical protein B0186_11230 [Canicola haemoglobinophilus]|uniref:Uncharacterized protein n=1 Tax=Canicola haemoglobinophilus TaxID=733 RepID=A0A1V4AYD5_9PAST|nr:hypothetical protein [Canicola haemoglobinophilus]OOR95815.1 hypothetical protein B0186_11230 [Canicola haemoglobinophilus]STO59550.1 Uncharacterised protein [Canicola haemoglobinophilus]